MTHNLIVSSSTHTCTDFFHYDLLALCNCSWGAVRESSAQCLVSVGGGSLPAVCLCYTCPTVSTARGGAASRRWPVQGHSSQWSDRLLSLFSSAALRDRCKCSSTLDAVTETGPAARHLFITLCSVSLLRLLSLFHPVPSRTGFIIPACSFFTPPVLLEMWIKVTAGAAEMTESACLRGHLSPSPPPFDFSCPPHPPTSYLSSRLQLLPHSI